MIYLATELAECKSIYNSLQCVVDAWPGRMLQMVASPQAHCMYSSRAVITACKLSMLFHTAREATHTARNAAHLVADLAATAYVVCQKGLSITTNIVCIAGITPLRAMLPDMLKTAADTVLLYSVRCKDEAAFLQVRD